MKLSDAADEEIKKMLVDLYEEEEKISYRRRIMHAKIDLLEAELTMRLKNKRARGEAVITKEDIEKASEVLSKKITGVARVEISKEQLF